MTTSPTSVDSDRDQRARAAPQERQRRSPVITARFSHSGPSSSEFVGQVDRLDHDQAGDEHPVERAPVALAEPADAAPHQRSSSSGRLARTRKPPASIALGAQVAAVEADAIAQPREPSGVAARAVVGHLELQLARPCSARAPRRSRAPCSPAASSASSITRYAVRSTPGGSARRQPSQRRGSRRGRARGSAPTSASSRARPGCGASSAPSPSRRSTPSSVRISVSASRPVVSTAASAAPARARVARLDGARHGLAPGPPSR